jgi:hypothetical protein
LIEEYHKVTERKAKMGSGECVCLTTETARYFRRKTRCSRMEWECGSAVEKLKEMCAKNC